MKPEKQRTAIAKACGLKEPKFVGAAVDAWSDWRPDYLNDASAMHEVLVLHDRANFVIEFERALHAVLIKDEKHICESGPFYWLATSAQLAEAFLKTMNLWTDED